MVANPPESELTLQVPPLTELVTVTGVPIHAVEGVGLIVPAEGKEFTVTLLVEMQPVDNV